MKAELVDVNETRKNLTIEIPRDVVDAEIDRVARDYSRKARIPGFRPGKAPARVIKQRFRDQILHDVAHELVPSAIDEAMRERGLEPVDTPDVRDVNVEEGQALTFTASFDTVPPFEPGDLSTVSLRRPRVAIDEQAVPTLCSGCASGPDDTSRSKAAASSKAIRSRWTWIVRDPDGKIDSHKDVAVTLGAKVESAGVRRTAARSRGRRDEDVRHSVPGRLHHRRAAEHERRVHRHGEGNQAAGRPRTRRRVRQGSRRLPDARCACGRGSARTWSTRRGMPPSVTCARS